MPTAKQDAFVLASTLTFRTLLDALARPGKIVQLASPAFLGPIPSLSSQTLNTYALAALLTLLDRETSFALASHGHWLEEQEPLVQWLVLRTGSHLASPEQAAFALFCDQIHAALATHLSMGTLLEPETSATVLYCVEQIALSATPAPSEADAFALELRGPGIADVQRILLRGITEEILQTLISTRRGYPLGLDAFLVDASGQCIGLPRTTRITWTAHDDM